MISRLKQVGWEKAAGGVRIVLDPRESVEVGESW
jgi:hypothetical protein